ncbi:MAG: L-2-amino-thiazoline-4-carboxylic acid hydrolase [Planctomycetota bacterium]
MLEAELRAELYDSFKNRAMIYWLIYDELRQEVGPERAENVLSRAIYRRGMERGREKYRKYGPRDLKGLKEAFLGGIADDGKMFSPEIVRDDAEGLDIKFHACPLRDAWLEAGLKPEDVAALCRIASRVDYGTFEGAGFRFTADTWTPGDEGCCYLHIRQGAGA